MIVPAQDLQGRRLLDTGEPDEKVAHLALGAALNVSAQERADHAGVKVERNRSGPVTHWTVMSSIEECTCLLHRRWSSDLS